MINIAIFGFGVVGGGTAEVLTQNARLISERVGDSINIKYKDILKLEELEIIEKDTISLPNTKNREKY